MSPPCLPFFGLMTRAPWRTFHLSGTSLPRKACQPWVVLPSKSSFQPSAFSFSVSVFRWASSAAAVRVVRASAARASRTVFHMIGPPRGGAAFSGIALTIPTLGRDGQHQVGGTQGGREQEEHQDSRAGDQVEDRRGRAGLLPDQAGDVRPAGADAEGEGELDPVGLTVAAAVAPVG